MKLSVTEGFIDKDTGIYRQVGDIVEYPEARAKEIEYKGYGKCLDKPKPAKAEPKSEEPKRRTQVQPKKERR